MKLYFNKSTTYKASNIHDFIFNWSRAVDGELVGDLFSFPTLSLNLCDKRGSTYIVI